LNVDQRALPTRSASSCLAAQSAKVGRTFDHDFPYNASARWNSIHDVAMYLSPLVATCPLCVCVNPAGAMISRP
jgi:hypothetical protein